MKVDLNNPYSTIVHKVHINQTFKKGLAWTACTRLQKIWTSKISQELKTKFFRACVEPVLLYGSEARTLNKEFQKRLDGCYTSLLMKVKKILTGKIIQTCSTHRAISLAFQQLLLYAEQVLLVIV